LYIVREWQTSLVGDFETNTKNNYVLNNNPHSALWYRWGGPYPGTYYAIMKIDIYTNGPIVSLWYLTHSLAGLTHIRFLAVSFAQLLGCILGIRCQIVG
jgi:hypothetical protein